jgi:hypothetical protein
MTELADWETEGARARPSSAADGVVAPPALRAATWIGVVLLVAAGSVFLSTTLITPHVDESATHALLRVVVLVVVGAAAAVVGAVTLVLRLLAGALLARR